MEQLRDTKLRALKQKITTTHVVLISEKYCKHEVTYMNNRDSSEGSHGKKKKKSTVTLMRPAFCRLFLCAVSSKYDNTIKFTTVIDDTVHTMMTWQVKKYISYNIIRTKKNNEKGKIYKKLI